MFLHQSRADLGIKIHEEPLLPDTQGPGVMAADVLDVFHDERAVGLGGDVIQQLGDGREIPTWEYVVVDETVPQSAQLFVPSFLSPTPTYSAVLSYARCLPSGKVMH